MTGPRLTRSLTDRHIAGVCGGLAEYFQLDPSLVRIAWLIAVFFGGFGFLAYVILWIVLPEGDPAGRRSSAVEIAEKRYASGEITADELARIRADLER